MKRRLMIIGLIVVIVIAILVIVKETGLVGNSNQAKEQSPSGTQNIPVSSAREIDEIVQLPIPTSRISLIICPFTNSMNEITADSLQFYFPTLFKASWTPARLVNIPFDSYIHLSANNWGLFNPGKKFPDELAQSFAQSFGCKTYVTAKIDKKDSTYTIKLTLHRDNGNTSEKELSFPEDTAQTIPSELALAILEQVVPDKVTEAVKTYIKRPAAGSPASLRTATDLALRYYSKTEGIKPVELKHFIDADEQVDWLVPIYCNALSSKNISAAIAFSHNISTQRSETPRFRILYAAMLNNGEEYQKAYAEIVDVVKEDPDNTKALEVLASAVQNLNQPLQAEPLFKKLIQIEPESYWTNLETGMHKIDLAWQHRGSGWANSVSREGWKNFFNELNAANKCFQRCIQIDPNQPEAYTKLITVGMGLGIEKSEIREYFKRAQAIDPNNREPYSRYQNTLMPKWGGSIEELREFWTETSVMKLQNPYIYLYPVDGHLELAQFYSREASNNTNPKKYQEYFKNEQVWEDVNQAYERFFTYGIEDPGCHARYGYIAYHCGKDNIAFEQFELSNFKFKDSDLVAYQNLLLAYSDTAYKTGHYARAEEVAQLGLKYNHCEGCNNNFRKLLELAQKNMK